jgi:hypothetical protein
MTFPQDKEDVRKLKGLIFSVLATVSLLFAYTAIKCHSYGRTPTRFIVDMILRTLLISLPFCLAGCAFGFFKNRSWAGRCARYAGIMFGVIVMCLVLEMVL